METTPVAETGEKTLTWQVHPARERPVAAVLVVLVVASLAWLCAELMQHWSWGLLGAAVLLAALNRFFLPTAYRVDADGVTAHLPGRSRHLRWDEIRRFEYDERGGLLSRRRSRSVLDTARSLPLLFNGNCETIAARIGARLDLREDQPCDG